MNYRKLRRMLIKGGMSVTATDSIIDMVDECEKNPDEVNKEEEE